MRIDVKKILNEFWFNELWNEQQQQIDSCTSEDIKQRMSDLTKEDIFGNIKKSQKWTFYKHLINELYLKCYLK